MRSHARLAALIIVLALAAGCGGGASQTEGAAQAATELRVANISAPDTFDPVASPAGRRLQYFLLVYDPLIRATSDGSLEPALATAWEYNDDNTVFTLTLREGVTFSDGATFDAEAVKANLDHALQTSGPQTAQIGQIESVEAVSPTEVRIKLAAPNPALPTIFSQNLGLMVSPDALGSADLDLSPVGTGPYTLDTAATTPGVQYSFVRRDDYWDAGAYPQDAITIRVIEDRQAILQSLQTGELDAGDGNAEVAAAAERGDLEILAQPTDSTGIMLLDRAGTTLEPLGDVRVRQALNYAVDREAIVESIARGYGTPTSQFIPPGLEGYDPQLDGYYTFDPDRARQLLAEAGYADGFTLPILSSSASTTFVQAVAGYLADVGVTVEIVPASPSGVVSDLLDGKAPAIALPWGMTNTYLDAQLLLTPDAAYNPFKASDPEMLALLEEGAAQDADTRNATYQQLSARIVEQGWFLQVYVADAIYLVGPGVDNAKPTAHVVTPDLRGWQVGG